MRTIPLRFVFAFAALGATALLVGSCSDTTEPGSARTGRFGVLPQFATRAAGLIEIREIRFVLNRSSDSSLARDTTIQVAAGQDSVELILTVPLQSPDETFALFLELKDSTGAVVFAGGPVTVSPTTSGDPPVVQVPIQYVGVGANAAGVEITAVPPSLLAGEATVLTAVAFDGAENPIPGTPIVWRSLDEARAGVPNPDSGRVVASDTRGTARIVAELLTGPADTAGVNVQPLPTSIVADSGANASGTVGEPVEQPLVARLVAGDGLGVSGVWVRFAVTGGSGALSTDSALTDSTGRARTSVTLGPTAGSVTVEATAAPLPGSAAAFGLTAQPGTPAALAFTASPSDVLVNADLAPAPEVEIHDGFGNVVTGATNTVTLAIGTNPGGGTLAGETTVAAANGVAAFPGLGIDQAGDGYTLVASAAGLTEDTSAAFAVVALAQVVTWVNEAGGNWSDGANWSTGFVPRTTDTVLIDLDGAYTITLDVSDTVDVFRTDLATGLVSLEAGTGVLGATSEFTVQGGGVLEMSDGTLTGPAPVTVAGGATFGAASTDFIADVDVQGTLLLGHDAIVFNGLTTGAGSVLGIAGSTLSSNTDVTVANGFTVNGTLRLHDPTGGGRTVQLRVPNGAITNLGTIDINTDGGGTRFLHASVDHQGTWTVDHALTWNPTTAPSSIAGPVTLNAGIALSMQPGVAVSLDAGGSLSIGAGFSVNVDGGTLDWTGGTLEGNGSIQLLNVTFNMTPDLTVDTLGLNLGGTTEVNGPGTITVASGAVLSSESATINADVDVQGTLRLGHQGGMFGTLTTGPSSVIDIVASTLSDTSDITIVIGFTVNGTLQLRDPTGGNRTVRLRVPNGIITNLGVIDISATGTGPRVLDASVDNQGTWTINRNLRWNPEAPRSTNTGALTVDGALDLTQDAGDSLVLDAGTVTLNQPLNLNGGTVTWNGGTLEASNTGAGVFLVGTAATFTITPDVTVDTLVLNVAFGTLNGSGAVTVAEGATMDVIEGIVSTDLDVQGTLSVTGSSTLSGTLTTGASSLIDLAASQIPTTDVTIANGFTVNGTLRLSDPTAGARSVRLRVPAGIITNLGILDISASGGGARTLDASVDNQAAWNVNQPLTWNNEATASLNSGGLTINADLTLVQDAGESVTSTGAVFTGPATTLTVTGGSFTTAADGVVTGDGTLDVSGTTYLNDGVLTPGTSPGVLAFTGDLPQGANAQYIAEVSGLTAGTGYDQLTVSGAVTPAGELTLATLGFTPSVGDAFSILTFGARTGQFGLVTGLDLWPFTGEAIAYDTVWTGTELSLVTDRQVIFSADSAGAGTQDRTIEGLFRTNGANDFRVNITPEGEFPNTHPRWSPDRTRVTYTSNGLLHIATIEPDADQNLGVAHLWNEFSANRARYSPNGMHLAFECGDGLPATDVCTIADVTGSIATLDGIGDGGGTVFVTDSADAQAGGPAAFAWDPLNADRLAVVRDVFVNDVLTSRIFTLNFDGTGVSEVVTLPDEHRVVGPMDWSPDGRFLAIAVLNATFDQQIWTVDVGTAAIDTVSTPAGGEDLHPVFSPNSQEILFVRDAGCDRTYVITSVTGVERVELPATLFCEDGDDILGHDWSPDGSRIVLVDYNESGSGDIGVFVVPSTVTAANYLSVRIPLGRTRTTPAIRDKQPSWRP